MKEQNQNKPKFENDVQLKAMAEMLANYWLKKEEICKMFDLGSTRAAREKVSVIASELPVISSSKREGYKVATDVDSIELLEQADRELASRIKELEKRRKPLQRAIAKRKKAEQEKVA